MNNELHSEIYSALLKIVRINIYNCCMTLFEDKSSVQYNSECNSVLLLVVSTFFNALK